MNFMIYDLALLILFAIFVSIFLYLRRENLKRDGLLLLYRTKWGIKLINYVGKKFQRTFKALSYISIVLGYFLMAGMIYLFYTILKVYFFSPEIVRAIKVPPIMPLIPYLPQVFKLDFLPPFYFLYWIIILAVIAITHEFAHGIFAAYNKIKTKNTGFGFFPFFFPVFLAAFVELDEKKMNKQKKFPQMAILSAGTFANALTAIFSFIILIVFFFLAFTPSGVTFDSYSYSILDSANISMVNGVALSNISYENVLGLMNETGLNKIRVDDKDYLIDKASFETSGKKELFGKLGKVVFFDDAPAIKAGLIGAIVEFNGVNVQSIDDLEKELFKNSPGEKITIKTKTSDAVLNYELELGENPENKSLPLLGIGYFETTKSGITGKIYSLMSSFREPHVYYEQKFGWGLIIYNLLWWLILISISVAFVNMLPVGIFDGGRFFYLTILGITGSEKHAKRAFAFMTYLFLFLILLLIGFWIFSFIK